MYDIIAHNMYKTELFLGYDIRKYHLFIQVNVYILYSIIIVVTFHA